MNSAVILPVHNPNDSLIDYVRELIANGINKIIVVNDGSSDEADSVFDGIRTISECDLIAIDGKCGIAWALKEGLKYYLDQKYDEQFKGVVYAEYHGRYAMSDIERVDAAMDDAPDTLIISERQFDKGVERNKKIGNRITTMIFDFLYGIRMKDPQSGLRGFPNKIIPKLLNVDGVDYEFMLNMVIEGKKHGIPVKCLRSQNVSLDEQVYTKPYPKKNSGYIYKNLIIHFIKYIVSALVSFALDVTLFQVFVGILQPHHAQYILLSTIIARAISSVWTFTFNRKVVFHSTENIWKSLGKFYGLVIIQMLGSGVLVTLLFNLIRIIPEAVIKVIVDFCIFLISYKVEKMFIFK